MSRLILAIAAISLWAAPAYAQLVVFDPAVTTRNSVTATVKEYMLANQRQQHERLQRMAARLSALIGFSKFVATNPPEWQDNHAAGLPSTQAFERALYAGDPHGLAYKAIAQALAADPRLRTLPEPVRRAVTSTLATVELADSAIATAVHDLGSLRTVGRTGERNALEALERSVLDGSSAQSATAVLDKAAAGAAIGLAQRQARIQLLTHIVEQSLVDSKRLRDTQAAMLNMQLAMWRDAKPANDALVQGTAAALTTWRQP